MQESFINQMFDLRTNKSPKKTKKSRSSDKKSKGLKGNKTNENNYVADSNCNVHKQEQHKHKNENKELQAYIESPKSEAAPLKREFITTENQIKNQNADNETTAFPGLSKSKKQISIKLSRPLTFLQETQQEKLASFSYSKNFDDQNITNEKLKHTQLGKSLSPKPQAKVLEGQEFDLESPSFLSEVVSDADVENNKKEDILSSQLELKLFARSVDNIQNPGYVKDPDLEKNRKDNFKNEENEQKQENDVTDSDEEAEVNPKLNITFWEYLASYIWKTQKLKEKIALLNRGRQNVEERLDIYNIMKKFREVDKLKALLLEDDQLILFEGLPKPEIKLQNHEDSSEEKNNFAHSLLRKPKFVEEITKEDQVLRSYNVLKAKAEKTMIDHKLINIYDDIVSHNPTGFMSNS